MVVLALVLSSVALALSLVGLWLHYVDSGLDRPLRKALKKHEEHEHSELKPIPMGRPVPSMARRQLEREHAR